MLRDLMYNVKCKLLDIFVEEQKMTKLKSNLLLLVTAVIWGFAFVAQRVGAEYVGAFTFNGFRFILGSLSLIPVFMIFEKRDCENLQHSIKLKRTLLAGALAGIMLFTASTLQQVGIEMNKDAGKTGFITALYTVLVPLFGIFLGKKAGLNAWIGAVFAVIGIFLLSVTGDFRIETGDLIVLVGALFWAFHILIIDYFVDSIYAVRFAALQFFFCAVLSLICMAIFEEPATDGIRLALVPILYGGIGSVGIAYTCQILGQKGAEPTSASIILASESLFGAIGGAIILNEVMSGRGYIGCVLIFAGIIISQLNFGKKQ